MAQTRRDFLRGAACALGGVALASTVESLGLVNAYAQAASDYRALVCVFLNGGNDGDNTLISLDPFNGPAGRTTAGYSNVRNASALAFPQSSLIPISPASGGPYGLNPNL